jgi:alcohol dehydrogenase class IV
MGYVSKATEVADNIRNGQDKIGQVSRLLGDRSDDKAKAIKKAGDELHKKLTDLNKKISGDNELQGIVRRPDAVTAVISEAMSYFRTTQGMPGSNEQAAMNRAINSVNNLLAEANALFANDWANYQKLVNEANITIVEAIPQVK